MSSKPGSTTAVTLFHQSPDVADFKSWAAELLASAARAEGFEVARISVLDHPELDWAVAATFRSEAQLHAWLDGDERLRIAQDGQNRGFWRRTADLVLREGAAPPPGVGVFMHNVLQGREKEFESAQVELTSVSSTFPGYDGTVVLPADMAGEWVSLLRFRTAEQLSGWMASSERSEALPDLRSNLTKDFAIISNTTPFGTTVRVDEDGGTEMTPNWKVAMMVLLVLYPTVMLLSRFVGPHIDAAGAPPWLALWLSQVCSVTLMTWWLSPWAAKPFTRWLDPVEGRGWRISAIGAAAVLVLYAVTLLVFANVHYLQFWDYMN